MLHLDQFPVNGQFSSQATIWNEILTSVGSKQCAAVLTGVARRTTVNVQQRTRTRS